jgi:hypothetical protein
MKSFAERTGIIISVKPGKPVEKTANVGTEDRSRMYSEYFGNTGKVPPLNLHSWVSCYTIITGTGIF